MGGTSITTIYTTSINDIVYYGVLVNFQRPLPVFSKEVNFNPKEIFYGIRFSLSRFPVVLTSFLLELLDHFTNIFPVLVKPHRIINV